jgi:two-component system sensor histidine kinase HydH
VEQAFDDFYTTKAEGSGLGLSLVRRVADAHGGSVEIASEPGRGTRVVIRLPDR